MKKIQKRLLGVGGIALVAAITTVACNIPDVGAMTASGRVDVSVSVISENPEVKIESPLDGAKITTNNLHIVVNYSDADAVVYTLTKGSKTIVLPEQPLAGNATEASGHYGTHDFIYNLKEFDPDTAGYGDYVLNVKVDRLGRASAEDSVKFSYYPATVDSGSIPVDENNNPIVSLDVKTTVVKVEAIVENADGTEAFRTEVDTDGKTKIDLALPFSDNNMPSGKYTVKFVTYSYNWYGALVPDQDEATTNLKTQVTYNKKSEPTPVIPNPVIDVTVEEGVEKIEIIVYDKDGNEIFRYDVPVSSIVDNHIELPFDKYGLAEGEYLIAIIPYARNEAGELVPLISEEEAKRNAIRITYGSPEVPDTGNFFANLNLSSKDFLLTGLIVFAAVTVGGIFILRRKETRR